MTQQQQQKGDHQPITNLSTLREAFSLFDKNGNNEIGYRDVQDFLRMLGEIVSIDELKESGFKSPMSFESFCKFVNEPMMQKKPKDSLSIQKKKKKKKVKKSSDGSPSSPTTTKTLKKKKKKTTPGTPTRRRAATVVKVKNIFRQTINGKPAKSSPLVEFLKSSPSSKTRKRRKTVASAQKPLPQEVGVVEQLSLSAKLSELRSVFDRFDLEGKGELNVKETAVMMERLGLGARQQSIYDLFKMVNEEKPKEEQQRSINQKNMTINFEQFIALLKNSQS